MSYCIGLIVLVWCMQASGTFVIHDFDGAMRRDQFPHAMIRTKSVVGIDGERFYAFCKQLYTNYVATIAQQTHTIPRIIHQIWLGSELPAAFSTYVQSWRDAHPEWTYILWNDAMIASFGLKNQHLYDATTNYGQKSDIARYEIIERYGGVYVDIDCQCLAPLDILHETCDFYVGLQPLDSFFVQVNNALFGAVPHHPVLQVCIDTMESNWVKHKGAPQKCGPVHMSRVVYAIAGNSQHKDVVLPAIYFYPFGSCDKVIDIPHWRSWGAFSVHWWAKSWMPKKYRASAFQAIDNECSAASWND